MTAFFMLLFIVALVLGIVDFMKVKRPLQNDDLPKRRKWMSLWFVIAVVSIVFAMASVNMGTNEKEAAATPEEKKEEKEPVVEEVEAPEPEEPTIDETAQELLDIYREEFEGLASVEFSEEGQYFAVTPTDPKFVEGMEMLASEGMYRESWDSMVEMLRENSEIIADRMGKEYGILLFNPADGDKVLVVAMRGLVVYDAIDHIDIGEGNW